MANEKLIKPSEKESRPGLYQRHQDKLATKAQQAVNNDIYKDNTNNHDVYSNNYTLSKNSMRQYDLRQRRMSADVNAVRAKRQYQT